jgi:hypothetical protein
MQRGIEGLLYAVIPSDFAIFACFTLWTLRELFLFCPRMFHAKGAEEAQRTQRGIEGLLSAVIPSGFAIFACSA